MKAKDMFEKLGYEIYGNYPNKIVYRNTHTIKGLIYIYSIKQEHNNSALPKEIIFWKELKSIDFEYGRKGSYLYFELLQAINQQIKELGWDNE